VQEPWFLILKNMQATASIAISSVPINILLLI